MKPERIMRFGCPACVLAVFMTPACPQVFAAPQGANYQVTRSYFPAAAGNPQSASYEAEENTVDPNPKGVQTSASYSLQGYAGIAGVDCLPVIRSVTPADLSRFFTDQSASYEVQARSADGDTLQYRATQDGAVKAGPQSSSTLAWPLSAADKGRRTHSVEVIDPQGTVLKTQSSYIFRRPVK